MTRLDDDDVREIRRLSVEERATSTAIAARYGVDPAYVRRLIRGVCRPEAGGPTVNRGPRPFVRRRGEKCEVRLEELPGLIEVFGPISCPDPGTAHGRRLLHSLGVVIEPATSWGEAA